MRYQISRLSQRARWVVVQAERKTRIVRAPGRCGAPHSPPVLASLNYRPRLRSVRRDESGRASAWRCAPWAPCRRGVFISHMQKSFALRAGECLTLAAIKHPRDSSARANQRPEASPFRSPLAARRPPVCEMGREWCSGKRQQCVEERTREPVTRPQQRPRRCCSTAVCAAPPAGDGHAGALVCTRCGRRTSLARAAVSHQGQSQKRRHQPASPPNWGALESGLAPAQRGRCQSHGQTGFSFVCARGGSRLRARPQRPQEGGMRWCGQSERLAFNSARCRNPRYPHRPGRRLGWKQQRPLNANLSPCASSYEPCSLRAWGAANCSTGSLPPDC